MVYKHARRLKSEVEVTLPPKHELKIHLPLSPYQLHFYRCLLMKDFDAIQSAAEDANKSADFMGGGLLEEEVATGKKRHSQVVDLEIPVADETKSDWKRLQSLMMQLRKTCMSFSSVCFQSPFFFFLHIFIYVRVSVCLVSLVCRQSPILVQWG
jgi:SNF2 family DNA or RNA helicase